LSSKDKKMAIPDYQALMLPVLRAAKNGEVRISEVRARLADELNLTDEEKEKLLPSGKQGLFDNRVHWAKTYLGKAGLLEATKRAHFKITQRGLNILSLNPPEIDNETLNQFEEFKQFRERAAETTGEEAKTIQPMASASQIETPDEIMRKAHKQIEAYLAQDLLERILLAPPAFFEHVIVSLLVRMGYGGSGSEAGRVLGKSGDDGVDGVIDQDALGLDRVYIQAKRYAVGNNIGSGAIRDFFGSLDRHKAAKGLFVTTSSFSSTARETAEFLSKRIVLIDGAQLTILMIRHNIGCRTEQTLHIKKIDEDFFE
jgi:restriction system protein